MLILAFFLWPARLIVTVTYLVLVQLTHCTVAGFWL